jgi:hypothetical protein
MVEGSEAWPHLGFSAGTAGDVNGDGYADVILRAEGLSPFDKWGSRAYVYLGSATGLTTGAANWTVETEQAWPFYGRSVGTAGDVNGDGYAEVIVGAPGPTGLPDTLGQIDLYYGNGGPGLSLLPRQRRGDDSTPIAPLGWTEGDTFRLAALGRTPFGRGKVRLEWETKPLGSLFDGRDTGQSSVWTDTGTAGAELNEWVGDLQPHTAYHWRLRLRYQPAMTPFQQHSRWLTMPWNGWEEKDLHTGLQPRRSIYLPVVLRDCTTLP